MLTWPKLIILTPLLLVAGCDFISGNSEKDNAESVKTASLEAAPTLTPDSCRILTNEILAELFSAGKTGGNIEALEAYLHHTKSLQETATIQRRSVAFEEIWRITEKLDLWDGYIHFVNEHKDAPAEITRKATDKIHAIIYSAAKKSDTLDAYKYALNEFPGAPQELQNFAVRRSAELLKGELDKIARKPADVSGKPTAMDSEKAIFIGLELYKRAEHITPDDRSTLRIISSVFEMNEALQMTPSYANFLQSQKLSKISDDIQLLRADIVSLRDSTLKSTNKLLAEQSKQLIELKTAMNTQNENIANLAHHFASSWDKQKDLWANIKCVAGAAAPLLINIGLSRILPPLGSA